MNRRRFLKSSLLWIPVAPAIVRAQWDEPSRVASWMRRTVAGTFSPTDISGLQLWLKADVGVYKDAGTTPAANNDTVQQWNDQSGAGHNVSQATAGSRPTFKTSVKNGLPGVLFNGVGTSIGSATTTIWNTTVWTIYMVAECNYASGHGGNPVAIVNQSCANIIFDGLHAAYYNNPCDFNENFDGTTDLADIWSYWGVVKTGTGANGNHIYAMGNAIDVGTAMANQSAAALNIGVGSTGGFWFDSYIGEIVIYDSALDNTNRGKLETYLKNRWGL